jgi:hypothetical protein
VPYLRLQSNAIPCTVDMYLACILRVKCMDEQPCKTAATGDQLRPGYSLPVPIDGVRSPMFGLFNQS